MLGLTKIFHGTGNMVVLYSSFCFLKVLVDIKYKGVYGYFCINNKLYGTQYIDGKKSRLTSLTRMLGTWTHFVVRLKIHLSLCLKLASMSPNHDHNRVVVLHTRAEARGAIDYAH